MLLKTLLKHLKSQPVRIVHDSYDKLDKLTFASDSSGSFPYLEFACPQKSKHSQMLYFDILNFQNYNSLSASPSDEERKQKMIQTYVTPTNADDIIAQVNDALQWFEEHRSEGN